ncbi:hypothetical protein KPATCC21470_6663 [Kitasatospora purpeofusca]
MLISNFYCRSRPGRGYPEGPPPCLMLPRTGDERDLVRSTRRWL